MRKRVMTMFAALVLASVGQAGAQDPPTKPVLPAGVPTTGLFDAGFRGTSTDGDEARYERFRDLRNGATTLFAMGKNTDRYRFNANFSNAGYRDQHYAAEYSSAKVTVSGLYDGIPLNYMYDAPLAWTPTGMGDSRSIRASVRGSRGRPMLPGMARRSVSRARRDSGRRRAAALPPRKRSRTGRSITTSSRRTTSRCCGALPGCRSPTGLRPALAIRSDFTTTGRDGEMPWGASFAFTNANQLPAPIDHRNNELRLNTEWVNTRGMFRVEYWGSFFDNAIQALTWDNPIRATDFNNGLAPPSGPYDPAGYSNGNGPASGQMALWPSNMLNSAGATGMFKLLPRTTVNGNVTMTYMRQDESLLPWSHQHLDQQRTSS